MGAMNCPKCDREVVQQAKFCGYCGGRVATSCPSCGVLNPPDGLFCYDCGRSMTASEAEPLEPSPSASNQPREAGFGCPRCRAVNEPGSAYCYHCGLPLEEEIQAGNGSASGQSGYAHPFESPRTRANWTVGLLVVTCIAEFLWLVSGQSDDTLTLLGLVNIPTVVAFLMWMHRASRNLRALGAYGQRFSPGWAVGWWFIPIMFFFRPYQAMVEIWRGSASRVLGESDLDWKGRPVSLLLGWWWGLWIASNLLGLVWAFSAANEWGLISATLTVADGILAILVVRRITDRQEAKVHRVPAG